MLSAQGKSAVFSDHYQSDHYQSIKTYTENSDLQDKSSPQKATISLKSSSLSAAMKEKNQEFWVASFYILEMWWARDQHWQGAYQKE